MNQISNKHGWEALVFSFRSPRARPAVPAHPFEKQLAQVVRGQPQPEAFATATRGMATAAVFLNIMGNCGQHQTTLGGVEFFIKGMRWYQTVGEGPGLNAGDS
ncbi:unnamed protein product [Ostreobium quekettii]|uniref:Uncharacterized protein n=1 Tax=Ostreobium quekettii TaxID=121088 RepID=A0A8S1J737_9CHLO|nr:unnamed protein product [Ostreobium quekettii]